MVGLFLMHRVELKAVTFASVLLARANVPNAPCGVERLFAVVGCGCWRKFLMHRVELKDEPSNKSSLIQERS